MLERDEVDNGVILLVSDLETAADDVPHLARTVAEIRRSPIALRVYPLGPSSDARRIFGGLLDESAFRRPSRPGGCRARGGRVACPRAVGSTDPGRASLRRPRRPSRAVRGRLALPRLGRAGVARRHLTRRAGLAGGHSRASRSRWCCSCSRPTPFAGGTCTSTGDVHYRVAPQSDETWQPDAFVAFNVQLARSSACRTTSSSGRGARLCECTPGGAHRLRSRGRAASQRSPGTPGGNRRRRRRPGAAIARRGAPRRSRPRPAHVGDTGIGRPFSRPHYRSPARDRPRSRERRREVQPRDRAPARARIDLAEAAGGAKPSPGGAGHAKPERVSRAAAIDRDEPHVPDSTGGAPPHRRGRPACRRVRGATGVCSVRRAVGLSARRLRELVVPLSALLATAGLVALAATQPVLERTSTRRCARTPRRSPCPTSRARCWRRPTRARRCGSSGPRLRQASFARDWRMFRSAWLRSQTVSCRTSSRARTARSSRPRSTAPSGSSVPSPRGAHERDRPERAREHPRSPFLRPA